MHDLATAPSGCVSDPLYDSKYCGYAGGYAGDNTKCVAGPPGCGSPASFPYWVSFTLLLTFVMLEMFTGIILEGFGGQSDMEGDGECCCCCCCCCCFCCCCC